MAQPDASRSRRFQEPQPGQDLLRTSDVAALFQVSTRTVSEWARRGRVPCMRTPGGQWRYPAEPIRKMVSRGEYLAWDDLSRSAPTSGSGSGHL